VTYYHFLPLFRGDIIVAIDGKEVTGVRDVLEAIGLEAGKTIEVRLLRGSNTFNVNLTTAEELPKVPRLKR